MLSLLAACKSYTTPRPASLRLLLENKNMLATCLPTAEQVHSITMPHLHPLRGLQQRPLCLRSLSHPATLHQTPPRPHLAPPAARPRASTDVAATRPRSCFQPPPGRAQMAAHLWPAALRCRPRCTSNNTRCKRWCGQATASSMGCHERYMHFLTSQKLVIGLTIF